MSEFVLKLKDGADIIEELKNFARAENIDYGVLNSASGSLKGVDLVSSGSRGGFLRKETNDSFEVNSISGKISKKSSGEVEINIRVSLTSTGFTAYSGQLIKGKVSGALDITIRKIDTKSIIWA